MKRVTFALPALLLLAAGCTPGANLAALPPYTNDAYTLGAGEQIRI